MLGTGETRGEVDPVLAVVGTGSLLGERTKSSPPCGASRAGREMVADGRVSFFFSFFSFLSVVRVGARRADVLLTLCMARAGGSASGHGTGARRPGASSQKNKYYQTRKSHAKPSSHTGKENRRWRPCLVCLVAHDTNC